MIEQTAPKFLTRVYGSLLLIGLYYLWYRYPLQLNSSNTSPTYADTPVFLQVGKYVLILTVAAVAFIAVLGAEKSSDALTDRRHPVVALALLGIGGFGLAKSLATGDGDGATLALIVLPGVVLLAASLRWAVSFDALSRLFVFYSVVIVAVEAVQYTLWQTQGRLPALAYENSTSVRFGSLLDDPNGLALLIALLVPVAWVGMRKHKLVRLVIIAGLVGCLWLTQSFTGMASFAAAVFVGLLLLAWNRPERSVGMIVLFAVIGAGVYWFLSTSEYVAEVVTSKEGSIATRGNQLDKVTFDFGTLAGLNPGVGFIESSYAGLIVSVGLIPSILYFGAGAYAVARLVKRIREGERTPLHYGLFFFTIAYLIGSANLRLDTVFPVNLLYVLAICLTVTKHVQEKGKTAPPAPKRGGAVAKIMADPKQPSSHTGSSRAPR